MKSRRDNEEKAGRGEEEKEGGREREKMVKSEIKEEKTAEEGKERFSSCSVFFFLLKGRGEKRWEVLYIYIWEWKKQTAKERQGKIDRQIKKIERKSKKKKKERKKERKKKSRKIVKK